MEKTPPPPVGHYRRIQLARWIINEGSGTMNRMKFDETGALVDFGMEILPLVRDGRPFMTSGCPGRDGNVACNRPYGNERPSGPIRNFPFQPEPGDVEEIEAPAGIVGAARIT